MTPDWEAFEAAKEKIVGVDRQRLGIGTLGEKTVHAILKNYYAPDEGHQEIPIDRYVADVFTGEEIIEIQTRNFNKLRDKLSTFLSLYPVTIVYPIPRTKWLIWIDEETGDMGNKRKSPKKGSPYQAFLELIKIKMFLNHPNLRLRLAILDIEEYRLLNGWSRDKKKGSSRYDRIPIEFVEEIVITCPQDYVQFLPETLGDQFTSASFAKAAQIPCSLAQTVLNILYDLGVVTRVGKEGRMYLYAVLLERKRLAEGKENSEED